MFFLSIRTKCRYTLQITDYSSCVVNVFRIALRARPFSLLVNMVAFITELNSINHRSFIQNEFVLVDIWATWCGPCKMISPLVDEVSNIYQGKLSVGKLDADGTFTDEDGNVLSNKDIITELGVRNIPTLLLYKNGELVTDDDGNILKLVGNVQREKLVDFIDKHIS